MPSPLREGGAGSPRSGWRLLATQFLTFAAVGVMGFIAHYGTLVALVEGFGVHPVLGSALGFTAGGLVNYAMNYRFTFRSQRRHVEAMPRFFTIAGLGLVLNTALMALLVEHLAVPYLPAQVLVTGLLLLWHFGANRLWTFAHGREA